jgi:hypothetical protein
VGARRAAGWAGPGVGDGARPGVGRSGQRPVPHPGPDAHPVPDVDAHPGGDPDGDAGRFAHADAFSSTDVHARAFAHAASSNGNAHSLANGFSYAHRHGGSSPPTSATRPIGGIKWGSGHPGFGYRSVAADRRGVLGAGGGGRPGLAGGFAGVAPPAIPGAAVGARAHRGTKGLYGKLARAYNIQ